MSTKSAPFFSMKALTTNFAEVQYEIYRLFKLESKVFEAFEMLGHLHVSCNFWRKATKKRVDAEKERLLLRIDEIQELLPFSNFKKESENETETEIHIHLTEFAKFSEENCKETEVFKMMCRLIRLEYEQSLEILHQFYDGTQEVPESELTFLENLNKFLETNCKNLKNTDTDKYPKVSFKIPNKQISSKQLIEELLSDDSAMDLSIESDVIETPEEIANMTSPSSLLSPIGYISKSKKCWALVNDHHGVKTFYREDNPLHSLRYIPCFFAFFIESLH